MVISIKNQSGLRMLTSMTERGNGETLKRFGQQVAMRGVMDAHTIITSLGQGDLGDDYKNIPILGDEESHTAYSNAMLVGVKGVKTDVYYLCDSMIKASELVKTGTGLGNSLKRHCKGVSSKLYLMGNDGHMRTYHDGHVLMMGWFDISQSKSVTACVDLSTGEVHGINGYSELIDKALSMIVLIHLGDISVERISDRKNNGKPLANGKITNKSGFPVHVVDSSWNKIINRTEGFAVRGHYRLQPCGKGNMDRKLIWINAFEKNGYVRSPKSTHEPSLINTDLEQAS